MRSTAQRVIALPWHRPGVPRQLAVVAGVSSLLFAATARVVFRHLADEEADGHVVNVAGRQRMLAQRMAREALAFAAGDDRALTRLEGVAAEFRSALTGLLHGDRSRGLPASTRAAGGRLAQVDRAWPEMRDAIALLLPRAPQHDRREAAHRVVALADRLALASDAAVEAFDIGFADKVRRLRRRMTVLGAGGAVVLASTYLVLLADATRRTARAEAEVARTEAALREVATERRELAALLLSASEDERRRVAADLHDGPTQQLLGAAMLLEAIVQSADPGAADPSQAAQLRTAQLQTAQLQTAQKYLESAIEDTRRIIRDLRPPLLDDLGVAEALARSLAPIADDLGVELVIEADGLAERPEPRTEEVLYRVAHEAAVNGIRHSGAPLVRVSLDRRSGVGGAGDQIDLVVVDEGAGFEPDHVLVTSGRRPFGLLGMRERVESLGGAFAIETALGDGTTVKASVPA